LNFEIIEDFQDMIDRITYWGDYEVREDSLSDLVQNLPKRIFKKIQHLALVYYNKAF
jgi:hypothetical protein